MFKTNNFKYYCLANIVSSSVDSLKTLHFRHIYGGRLTCERAVAPPKLTLTEYSDVALHGFNIVRLVIDS